MEDFRAILLLHDYNTRLVVASTCLLGMASGFAGSFLLLRKRSLLGDALSHACLPGIALAFIFLTLVGREGKNLAVLLLGAAISGSAGVFLVMAIRRTTRLKDDAAMGIVLSVGFALGLVLLGFIQGMPGASAAGLETFIYGKTASMVFDDFRLLATVTVLCLAGSFLFMKEFGLLCFDDDFARALGYPVGLLDALLLAMIAAVTVAGLQAVGLILVVAYLVIPAAAARFWTDNLRQMLLTAAAIGGLSGWFGASLSALFPRLPAGAVIVLVAAAFFLVSLLFGRARGMVQRLYEHLRLKHKIGRQHLLRSIFELQENEWAGQSPRSDQVGNASVSYADLLADRSWNNAELLRLIRRARREDHIHSFDGQHLLLSEEGFGEASRITRNHRLWELFLIRHAAIASSHVDRDADAVEHILSPAMVRELERELKPRDIPRSPHPLRENAPGAMEERA